MSIRLICIIVSCFIPALSFAAITVQYNCRHKAGYIAASPNPLAKRCSSLHVFSKKNVKKGDIVNFSGRRGCSYDITGVVKAVEPFVKTCHNVPLGGNVEIKDITAKVLGKEYHIGCQCKKL